MDGVFNGWQIILSPQQENILKWITRERPKIDRIACPWLIARYSDKAPEFLYVPNVELGHHGDQCSFDAFIAKYKIQDATLDKLALIARVADTATPELAKQSEGLLAISRGLSLNFEDDHEMLPHGMVIYDALYAVYSKAPLTKPGKGLGA